LRCFTTRLFFDCTSPHYTIHSFPTRRSSDLQRHTHDSEDHIDKTVNYSTVAEAARNFARDQSVNLIETLADRLATYLLGNFAVRKITVELRKFVLPDAKHVSVTVTRSATAN